MANRSDFGNQWTLSLDFLENSLRFRFRKQGDESVTKNRWHGAAVSRT